MFLMLLLFLSSAFVPRGRCRTALRWVAEHQPFTPIIETLRGLLLGTPIGDRGVLAVAWCVVISLPGDIWALRLYERPPSAATSAAVALRRSTISDRRRRRCVR